MFPLCKDEILDVSAKIFKAGMSLLVIDTENKFVSTGFAKEIARVAQGILDTTSLRLLRIITPHLKPLGNHACSFFDFFAHFHIKVI